MLIRRGVIGLIVCLLLIFSGGGQAFAPVSANLQPTNLSQEDAQALQGTPQLIVDNDSIDLIQLLNSEIPLFNNQTEEIFKTAVTEINTAEKRVNISLNNAVIAFQFLNAAVDKTDNSFALRFSGPAQMALVITAPGIDNINDTVVEINTAGQGMKRGSYLFDLENVDGRALLKNMQRVDFPGKTAAYTFIVSGKAALSKDYKPANLVSIPKSVPANQSKSNMQLNSEAVAYLEKMLSQARNEGIKGFVLTSTYRSYSYQSTLFANKVKQVGSEAKAATVVARPGTSEHQTGLAIDFTTSGKGLNESFAATTQGQWLGKNAWRYGFILRYPSNKTQITKIIYEPWHFRYVGYPYSKIMYDRKLCLEEFFANLETYGFYAVSDQKNTYLCAVNQADGKLYLSRAVPKN